MFMHLTLVPYLAAAGEVKTKPTQHSVKELLSIGIQPDVLICRSDRAIPAVRRAKIALFCNVPERAVISMKDVDSIYKIPHCSSPRIWTPTSPSVSAWSARRPIWPRGTGHL